MSHKITTKTDIKDKKLAETALKAAGWGYDVSGRTIRVTSGPMRNASINLQTGEVVGDTDYHGQNELGALRQHYSLAMVKQQCIKQGATIESERVDAKTGDIVLVCSASFG